MELLVWHEALGCDDEQASESELLARVLYAHTSRDDSGGVRSSSSNDKDDDDDHARERLQTMHFVQGLLAFVRMLKRNDSSDTNTSGEATEKKSAQRRHKCLEWVSVTLSRRRFFIQEVEPQIYFALGIEQAAELREHRFVYSAIMRDLYGMFCLFHGRIDSNLQQLPVGAAGFADGMELLLAIQAARKRIRKLDLLLESCRQDLSADADDGVDDDRSNDRAAVTTQDARAAKRLESDRASAQRELDALLAVSPAVQLTARFAAFFPTLLRALDVLHASSLHELIGVGQFPLAPSAFLSLQSFLSAFELELGNSNSGGSDGADGVVAASALFFKGNLLCSSVDAPTLRLLYRFLQLREEHGMELDDAHGDSSSLKMPPASRHAGAWMNEKYRETFRPIWSSRTSYTECAVVTHARRHPRQAVRSLHRQTPLPLAAVVADANAPPHTGSSGGVSSGGAGSSRVGASADDSSGNGNGSATRTLSASALKARIKAVAYRNTGLLMQNGYFAKTFELPLRSRGRGKFSERDAVEFIWKPRVFAVSGNDADDTRSPEPSRYAALWHESDLSMLLLVNDRQDASAAGSNDPDDPDATAARVLATLSRIEDAMDRLKFHELAALLLSQSSPSTLARSGGGGASRVASGSGSNSPAYPFVYLNRADATFKALQIPRIIKRKDADAYPLPLRLLAHYLPRATLDLLNELHSELHKCGRGETRDVCVKTLHDGWLLAKKSQMTQREFYAFFDTKVPSVADLSDALEDLLQDQFGNVFF